MMIMGWCAVQTNEYDRTICKAKLIRLFALIINCTMIMKTNSLFSRNVFARSDRIWCNKHIRHTTTEKYDNNRKSGTISYDRLISTIWFLMLVRRHVHIRTFGWPIHDFNILVLQEIPGGSSCVLWRIILVQDKVVLEGGPCPSYTN